MIRDHVELCLLTKALRQCSRKKRKAVKLKKKEKVVEYELKIKLLIESLKLMVHQPQFTN